MKSYRKIEKESPIVFSVIKNIFPLSYMVEHMYCLHEWNLNVHLNFWKGLFLFHKILFPMFSPFLSMLYAFF